MDWKKLALCAALTGTLGACGGGTDQPMMEFPDTTHRYVLSAIEIPEAEGSGADATAVGFNLDGVVSTGTGSTCVDLTPDYLSANDPGENGVDNALATLVPQLGMLLGDSCPAGTPAAECLSTLLQQQIQEGSLLLIMEVSGINSYRADNDVTLQLYLGTVPGCDMTMPATCAPMISGGMLAPDQEFDVMAVGSAVSGSIAGRRLTAQTDMLTISINTMDLSLDLVLRNAEVRATLDEDGALTNGAIGGSLRVEDIANAAEMIMAGLGMTVRSVLGGIADMEPQAADPTTCDSLSAGIRFEAVGAGNDDPNAMP